MEENLNDRRAKFRLYRSSTDRVIAGVCGGIGEYFEIDSTIVRIVFVILALIHGSGILLYILLWVIIPSEEHGVLSRDSIRSTFDEMRNRAKNFDKDFSNTIDRRPSYSLWAWVLVILGGLFLLNNFDLLGRYTLRELWPVVLIGVGIVLLTRKK